MILKLRFKLPLRWTSRLKTTFGPVSSSILIFCSEGGWLLPPPLHLHAYARARLKSGPHMGMDVRLDQVQVKAS